MAEYIDREAFKKSVEEHYCKPCKAEGKDRNGCWCRACWVDDMLDEVDCFQSAADVAPVRHGRWNDGDPYCPICRKDKFRGLDADVWADWKPDYCPNCGADMRGSNDE